MGNQEEVYPTPDIGDWLELYLGILWLRMPLPYALDHVNLYLLEDVDGWYLVDTGLNYPGTHEVWKRVVAQALGNKPLKGILATHYHPDHVGSAGWPSSGSCRYGCQLKNTTMHRRYNVVMVRRLVMSY
ncbi:MAG: MBL fold metallo-hydrolase [Motiliproteus sp.]